MRGTRKLGWVLLAGLMTIATMSTGCTVHAGYYDPYYHDQHRWAVEEPYYNRWEQETHRRHEEFRRRNKEEQREYWEWRHHQH